MIAGSVAMGTGHVVGQSADDEQIGLVRGKRLQRFGQFVVGADAFRLPVRHDGTVREEHVGEPTGSRSVCCGPGRSHRIQHRQCKRGTDTLKERSSCKRFHHFTSCSARVSPGPEPETPAAVCHSVVPASASGGSSPRRIRNGSLVTIAFSTTEKR